MRKVRYIYSAIIVLLLIAAAVSLWEYKKANDAFNAEEASLQKVWDDHNKKVESMEAEKKKLEDSSPMQK